MTRPREARRARRHRKANKPQVSQRRKSARRFSGAAAPCQSPRLRCAGSRQLRVRCGAGCATLARVTAAGPRLALFYAAIFLARRRAIAVLAGVARLARARAGRDRRAAGRWDNGSRSRRNPLLGMLADRARRAPAGSCAARRRCVLPAISFACRRTASRRCWCRASSSRSADRRR